MATKTKPCIWALMFIVMGTALLSCGSTPVVVFDAYARGVEHYDAGRDADAIEAFKESIPARPGDFRVYYNMGLAYHNLYLEGGDEAPLMLQAAQDNYDKTLELSKGNARALAAKATLIRDSQSLDDAIAYLGANPASSEDSPAIRDWTLGTMMEKAGRDDEAMASYRSALKQDDSYEAASTALTRMLLRQGLVDDANMIVEKGLEKDSTDFSLRLYHGIIGIMHARGLSPEEPEGEKAWEVAFSRLRLAHTLQARDWQLSALLAECHLVNGEIQEAVQCYWHARDWASDRALRDAGHEPDEWRQNINQALRKLYALLAKEGR